MKKLYLRILSLLPHFIYKRIDLNKLFQNSTLETIVENNRISIELFDGQSEDFRAFHRRCKVYAEYGCGLSTLYSVDVGKKQTLSVDTDDTWVQNIKKNVSNSSYLKLNYVDVGPTGNWGMPQTYSKRENFKNYLNNIWEYESKPDFILIDGRFRVASFLTCLKFAELGTVICFDDYVNRKIYHLVEEFEKPFLKNKRQAYFKVNNKHDSENIDLVLNKFEYVLI